MDFGGGRGLPAGLAALVWPRLLAGCRPNRETLGAIERAGFEVERCRGFGFPPAARAHPVAPRILGAARVDLFD